MWKLACRKKPGGVLHTVRDFLGPKQDICLRMVRVPLEGADIKWTIENAGILADDMHTRSFEMWWDADSGTQHVVLAAETDDMAHYERCLRVLYPNCTLDDLPPDATLHDGSGTNSVAPAWYDPDNEHYRVFDAGYRHGHFGCVFDVSSGMRRDAITQITSVAQLARHAWIQIVFRRCGMVADLQRLSSILHATHHEISDVPYTPLMQFLFSDGDNAKQRPHPEKGHDLSVHYSMLQQHIESKAQGAQILVSARGLLSDDFDADFDFGSIHAAGNSGGGYDYIITNKYDWKKFNDTSKPDKKCSLAVSGVKLPLRRAAIFDGRLLPHPRHIKTPIAQYTSKRLLGDYHTPRRSPPFIIMSPAELGLLVRLPDPAIVPHAPETTRDVAKPLQPLVKSGFNLGFADRSDSLRASRLLADAVDTTHDNNIMGIMTDAAATNSVVLSPDDIPTHIYLAGGTKSGKTTLIRCMAKHMEMANLRSTMRNAFILVDPKGSDSYDFLRQCESESYDRKSITFLDPIETKFSINVLELPAYHTPEERQVVVSQYVGYIMQMIEYWYHDSDTFVRLKRILDTLLQYVYLQNDKPTFLDLYEIVVSMQQDGRALLVRMFKALGKPESVLQQAIEAVAGMQKEAYEPVLNRLEKFATDPILRHMFCVRESTVRFEDLIAPGAYTVIRLSPLNIPQHIITLTKQTIVIKLWFAIQERAERVKQESERTQVLLALDEFQDLADLPVIEAMLTQARSYGLGLLLAHQTTTQLKEGLFEVITGNAGTQFVGRVSGRDGERFGNVWDPAYSKEYKKQLATQEYHHWTARLVAGGGEAQPLPVQFWPLFVPKERQTDEVLAGFIESERARFGCGIVGESILAASSAHDSRWLEHVPYEPPSRDEWQIICILAGAKEGLLLRQVTAQFADGTTASNTISATLRRMLSHRMVALQGRKYVLPGVIRRKYLEFDPAAIGTALDIPQSTAAAVSYYVARRNFVCVAPQKIRRGKLRTDLVAYDYDDGVSISVEIESHAEVTRHPEHVRLNMTKWQELGFERCDVWSTHPGIGAIYDDLNKSGRRGVRTFVVGMPTDGDGLQGGTAIVDGRGWVSNVDTSSDGQSPARNCENEKTSDDDNDNDDNDNDNDVSHPT